MKVVVFTAILGTSDSLKPAPTGVDAVCFVDNPADYPDPKGWDLRQHAYAGDPRREAWRLRCVPHELFPGHDRSIWIDASFTLTDVDRLLRDTGKAEIAALRHHARKTCFDEAKEIVRVGQASAVDVERQMGRYLRSGYLPTHLSISCIIVRSRTPSVEGFNVTWFTEIAVNPGDNTQLSLDYAAWRNGLTIKALQGVRKDNPYAIHDHADHKRRRKPYVSAVTA